MEDTKETGAQFKICSPAFDLWGNNLIPGIKKTVGGAYVIVHGCIHVGCIRDRRKQLVSIMEMQNTLWVTMPAHSGKSSFCR